MLTVRNLSGVFYILILMVFTWDHKILEKIFIFTYLQNRPFREVLGNFARANLLFLFPFSLSWCSSCPHLKISMILLLISHLMLERPGFHQLVIFSTTLSSIKRLWNKKWLLMVSLLGLPIYSISCVPMEMYKCINV